MTEDWQYNHFTPEWSNVDFRPTTDGMYEAFIVKHPDLYRRYFQPVFWIFPHLDEWATNDLFTKHPAKPDQWKYAGRADDIIVLGTGIKFAPTQHEQEVFKQDSIVKHAVILGNRRQFLSVIVELQDPALLEKDRAQVDAHLQSIIDAFNRISTQLCQLSLERVVFCEAGETIPRTAKGTFSRKQIEGMFAERLEQSNPVM